MSKIPYASKLFERYVSAQLCLHLQHNIIRVPFQSAYLPSHSVETAIACITDDILRSLDYRKHVVLVLLDLSAAFDTIDHDLLLAEFILPTEHSASVLTVIFPATSNCNTEFYRVLFSFLSTVQVFQRSSQSTEFATTSSQMIPSCMLTFRVLILRQPPTGYPVVLLTRKYGWHRATYF